MWKDVHWTDHLLPEGQVYRTPQHIQLYQPEKWVEAEHSIDFDHWILLNNPSDPDRKSGCMNYLIKGATELHPNHSNWKEGFSLTR